MPPRGGRFRRSSRLRRSHDFRRVSRTGARRASAHFVVLVAPRGPVGPWERVDRVRLGLAVGRRVGSAVRRNRLRRRLREWFRHNRDRLRESFGEDIDVVVIARAGAAELSWRELTEELGALVASPRGGREGKHGAIPGGPGVAR